MNTSCPGKTVTVNYFLFCFFYCYKNVWKVLQINMFILLFSTRSQQIILRWRTDAPWQGGYVRRQIYWQVISSFETQRVPVSNEGIQAEVTLWSERFRYKKPTDWSNKRHHFPFCRQLSAESLCLTPHSANLPREQWTNMTEWAESYQRLKIIWKLSILISNYFCLTTEHALNILMKRYRRVGLFQIFKITRQTLRQ